MDEITTYYEHFDEADRLTESVGALEFARTQQILLRHLPEAPALIVDVGGGPGVYSLWLASKGYEVHLVELSPRHVEQARRASAKQSERPIRTIRQGDARDLPQEDGTADAILLFGPLYHLTEESDRLQALREAWRVLRPGGLLAAAAISRFASLMDGLLLNRFGDERFARIVEQDLRDGQHRNETENRGYFTTAFFHHPDELAAEAVEAGFENVQVLAVEGPGWAAKDFEACWADAARRERILNLIRAVEAEPSLLGMSAHLLAMATKPS